MSLFPRFPPQEFTPLFRLLDDYDTHRAQTSSHPHHRGATDPPQHIRAFQPRFDVRELSDAYELHGELPGIEQKDVDIEFADPHTLVVKGRVERTYESGSPAQGRIEEAASHKATVEDDEGEAQKNQEKGLSKSNGKHETQVSKKTDGDNGESKGATYWILERSVGEFHRSFNFPSRVDQDGVKANLKNGVLTVRVPKAVEKKGKKIVVE